MGPLRRGVTVRQVRDSIQGDWSLRTIRRDLVLLESIGLVERDGVHWRALRSSRLEDFLKGKLMTTNGQTTATTTDEDPFDIEAFLAGEPFEDDDIEESFVAALIAWRNQCLQRQISREAEIADLKDQQSSLVLKLSAAEAEYKAAKKEHKELLEKLYFLSTMEQKLPDAPTREKFRQQIEAEKRAEEESANDQQWTGWEGDSTEQLIAEIDGLGKKKISQVIELFPTLGDLQKARIAASNEWVHFAEKLPKGIGEQTADAISEKLLDYITEKAKQNASGTSV